VVVNRLSCGCESLVEILMMFGPPSKPFSCLVLAWFLPGQTTGQRRACHRNVKVLP
jgi:hypothetical protein